MQRGMKSLLIVAAIAGAIASYCPGASAQPTPIRPGDDMRTLAATPMDIADGKRLAGMDCSSCHGSNGISASQDVPNIAGQRPAYLYLALKAYQAGARGKTVMNDPVKFLSDDALVKVAAYFASLDPAPLPTVAAGPAKLDAVQAGKAISAACAGCHGNTGVSQIPGIPSLAGLDPKYQVDAMQAYKNGQRKDDTMKAMVAALSDASMNNVALLFRAPGAGARQDTGRRRPSRRQGGRRRRLRRMPRRQRREQQSGDAKSGRTRCQIPRGGAAGL